MRCGACNHDNPPAQKFCGECGAALGGAPVPKPAAPEQYTPKHLAERILGSRSAMEGERKQVTVLFADLKGSMELLADRDSEKARKILDPVAGSRATKRGRYLLGNIHGYGASANMTQARESYQQALVLAHELGMRPLEGQSFRARGAGQEGRRDRRRARAVQDGGVDAPRNGWVWSSRWRRPKPPSRASLLSRGGFPRIDHGHVQILKVLDVPRRECAAPRERDACDLSFTHIDWASGPLARRGQQCGFSCGYAVEIQDATSQILLQQPPERRLQSLTFAALGQQGEAETCFEQRNAGDPD
jgi:hypothetical protein